MPLDGLHTASTSMMLDCTSLRDALAALNTSLGYYDDVEYLLARLEERNRAAD